MANNYGWKCTRCGTFQGPSARCVQCLLDGSHLRKRCAAQRSSKYGMAMATKRCLLAAQDGSAYCGNHRKKYEELSHG